MSLSRKRIVVLSACLGGVKCRYDGKDKRASWYELIEDRYNIVKICPEVLAGMPVPRASMQFLGGDGKKIWEDRQGKVIDELGEDVTETLKKGALIAMQICRNYNVDFVILKDKSPSCGLYKVYYKDIGLGEGIGIWAYLLQKANYRLFNEDEFKIV